MQENLVTWQVLKGWGLYLITPNKFFNGENQLSIGSAIKRRLSFYPFQRQFVATRTSEIRLSICISEMYLYLSSKVLLCFINHIAIFWQVYMSCCIHCQLT